MAGSSIIQWMMLSGARPRDVFNFCSEFLPPPLLFYIEKLVAAGKLGKAQTLPGWEGV